MAAELPTTMRAIVLDAPGPPSAFQVRTVPLPVPKPGWVLISVRAFGLNRSELHTRLGMSPSVKFPRVLGIEATGVVAACPGGEFAIGASVMAMMGEMGRQYDGGYAEYTCVPAAQVMQINSTLDWATLGAVPEMLQTSHGSLTTGLDARAGETLLIRGGTSSVGMTVAILAKARGMTVITTTRSAAKAEALRKLGADHVLIDDGSVQAQVRAICPNGVDRALELVGANVLHDTLRCVRVHGVCCMSGCLSNEWIVKDFYPQGFIPTGVFFTGYSGNVDNLPREVLQGFLDDVAAGRASVPLAKSYTGLESIVEAHTDMEENRVAGKLVVVLPPPA